jgi:hypothetical protein
VKDKLFGTLAAMVVIALVIGSLLIWTKAPCGLWTYSPARDTPARCLMEH